MSKTINRDSARQIHEEAHKAMSEVAARFGLVLEKRSRATYSESLVTLKFTLVSVGEDGEAKTREREEFLRYAQYHGLDAKHLGAIVEINGKRFEITGLAVRRSRYPILAREVASGRSMKLTLTSVKQALGV